MMPWLIPSYEIAIADTAMMRFKSLRPEKRRQYLVSFVMIESDSSIVEYDCLPADVRSQKYRETMI